MAINNLMKELIDVYVKVHPHHVDKKFFVFDDEFILDKKEFIKSMALKPLLANHLPDIEGVFVVVSNSYYYRKCGNIVECGINTINHKTKNFNDVQGKYDIETQQWIECKGRAIILKGSGIQTEITDAEINDAMAIIYNVLLNLLVFINLSEDKIVYDTFKPNERKGSKKFGNLRTNPTKFNVSYVKSNWNVVKIFKGIVKVRGHFRLQPCGVGRNDVKLILIEEHVRKQFTKPSKREEILNSRVS